jgi:SAM-dependent methyltransferase
MRVNLNELFIRDAFAQAFADAAPGGRILDLGCGVKPYASFYEPHFTHCVAADYAPRRPDISLCVDAQSLPFADASFDAVLFSEVVEHVPRPADAIMEIGRVLRPGGMLVLSWPMHYSLHEIPWDYSRLTEFGMDSLCRAAGLEIVWLRRRGDAFAVSFEIVSHLMRGLAESMRRLPGIGRLLRPVAALTDLLLAVATRLLYGLERDARRLKPSRPGAALTGVAGHLCLWTLGYCAIARKAHRP